jgi:hypothetical protein
MSLLHLLFSVLWLVPVALQIAIASVMLWRGLAGAFPLFLAYTVLVPARDLILLLFPYPGNRYSFIFWWGDAVAILLSLGVIFEVLWQVFQPYPFLRFVFKLFWIAAAVATASALALLRTGPRGGDRVLESIILMERSARVLQLGLLIFLISFMSRLGLTWYHYAVGVAAGFGIYSALDLALLEFRGLVHSVSDTTFALLSSGAYNLAVVIWAFYFLKVRRETPVDSLPSSDLANWNDTLTEHVDRWYRR